MKKDRKIFTLLTLTVLCALVLGLYKPLTAALRRTRLLPETTAPKGDPKPGLYLFALGLLATCVVLLLVLKGIL